jgi:hypothetical protein
MPHSAAATVIPVGLLDWGTRNSAVRAVHAAIARQRLEQRMTLLALVAPLAGVGAHCFSLRVTAHWAGQRRLECDIHRRQSNPPWQLLLLLRPLSFHSRNKPAKCFVGTFA